MNERRAKGRVRGQRAESGGDGRSGRGSSTAHDRDILVAAHGKSIGVRYTRPVIRRFAMFEALDIPVELALAHSALVLMHSTMALARVDCLAQ